MPRKIKAVSKQDQTTEPAPAEEPKPKSKPAAKRPASAARKAKSPAKRAGVASTAAKPRAGSKSAHAGPTDEEIQLRAYFVSERRHRLGLPGDASSDWLEAMRQLVSEAGPR